LQDKPSEAEPLLRRALAVQEGRLGPNHPATAKILNNLASVLRDQGHLQDDEPLFRRAWIALEAGYGPDHVETKRVLLNYLVNLRRRGRNTELKSVLKGFESKRAE
jgi:hypothetical protein